MGSPLTRRLVVITGKGGVGKTTIAAALGLRAAGRGLRAIVVELGGRTSIPELLGEGEGEGAPEGSSGRGSEVELAPGLWSTSIDADRALLEWLGVMGGSIPARLLVSRATFRCFAAAAPGASELVSLVKVWELTQDERWGRRGERYDVVLLDAPATGHALAMLRSPRTFGAIARIGPVATQAREVQELLEDPARSSYVAVAQASDMAVTETLELADGLQRELGRELDQVVVNGTFPRRFSGEELEAIASLDGGVVAERARRAVRFVHDRARVQHNQIERLRRRHLRVVGVPFVFGSRLDRTALEQIAQRLGGEDAQPIPRRSSSASSARQPRRTRTERSR
jgi:anion-transporting  ArsA/GET3 family ATPase